MNRTKPRAFQRYTLPSLLLASMVLTLPSCSKSGPELIAIEGLITYDGGPWPRKGMVYFVPNPDDYESSCRPAFAKFETDGHFEVSSYRPNDGLTPGKYLVYVECWESPPALGQPSPPSYVPAKYQAAQSSGLEVVVPKDTSTFEINLDIPKK